MNCKLSTHDESGGRAPRGMTLIELIGVVTIIAVLAGFLFPAAIRYLDQLAARREVAALDAIAEALRSGIVRQGRIPHWTNWAAFVSAEAGIDPYSVVTNARGRRRILLIDTNGWLVNNTPYVQTSSGAGVSPTNARMMIVSTIAGPEVTFGSGMPGSGTFELMWNTPEGTLPTAGNWTGWGADPYDVKVRRIDLSPLFHKVVLSTYVSRTNGQYSTAAGPTNAAPFGAGTDLYYLHGTQLQLFTGRPDTDLNHTYVVNEDTSFVFENGIWRSSILGGYTYGAGDVSGIVAAFLAATPNTNAANGVSNTQQRLVVEKFISYMSNYNRWESNNFPNAFKTHMGNVQSDMMTTINGLFMATPIPQQQRPSGYQPINNEPCPP